MQTDHINNIVRKSPRQGMHIIDIIKQCTHIGTYRMDRIQSERTRDLALPYELKKMQIQNIEFSTPVKTPLDEPNFHVSKS